jgi:hypothetical protein
MGQLAFERAGDPEKLRVKSRISQFLVDNDDKVIYMKMVHMPFERAGDPKKFRVKVGISFALSLFLLSDK